VKGKSPRARRATARSTRPWAGAAGLAALALALGCSTNPVTGRPEMVLMSSAQEAERGREVAGEVASQVGLVEDEALVGYVSEVGQRVAARSPRQDVTYSFYVLDMEEPNAFALPGGYVYVSRGLLALANEESELAGVLGHEIGHVAARHAAQRQTRAAGVGLVLLPAAVGGALLSSVLGMPGDLVNATVNTPLQMLGVGFIAAYSRDQEREADEVGQTLAAGAGFDPHGLSRFLASLEAYEKLQSGTERGPSFFDAHPTTPERVASTERRAASLAWTRAPGVAADRRAFLERIEGLRIGANPAEGEFREQLFLHPDLDFVVAFPEGWRTQNTRSRVGAVAPEEDAQILLELQGPGDDPGAAAEAALEELGRQATVRVEDSAPLRAGGLPGHRAHVVAVRGRESVALELTWLAKDGLVYRFTGLTRGGDFARHAAVLAAVPQSFRALRREERASIHELRLRLVPAQGGESLARLSDRTGNAWSEAETALANDLEAGTALRAGQLMKLALPQPYVSP
jgi:predicted Zn-dependent protease